MVGEAKKGKSDLSLLVPRGFLRSYVIGLLAKKPLHGYALMDTIEERTGFWRPSPGTIYPLLESMEKDGWIEEIPGPERKKQYRLTGKGVAISRKFGVLEEDLRNKASEILACVLGLDPLQIDTPLRRLGESYPDKPFKCPMMGIITTLAKIAETPGNVPQAVEILNKTCRELGGLCAGEE
ncbi:MAG: PadR family transcriptional regulator [Candidatus Aenigmatarchaeota archaeon]